MKQYPTASGRALARLILNMSRYGIIYLPLTAIPALFLMGLGWN